MHTFSVVSTVHVTAASKWMSEYCVKKECGQNDISIILFCLFRYWQSDARGPVTHAHSDRWKHIMVWRNATSHALVSRQRLSTRPRQDHLRLWIRVSRTTAHFLRSVPQHHRHRLKFIAVDFNSSIVNEFISWFISASCDVCGNAFTVNIKDYLIFLQI